MHGLHISSIRPYGGQIRIVGLDAVAAEFSQSTLERRGDDGSGNPIWTLHAVLSYTYDLLLKNESFEKKYVIEVWKDKYYQAVPTPDATFTWDNGHLIIEGVTLVKPDGGSSGG